MSMPVLTSLRSAFVVFTGRLASITREEAERRVREAGGFVVTQVSRRTSVLVVGMGGWPLARDGAVNYKIRECERINRDGPRIRILSEVEFLEILGLRERPAARKTLPAEEVVRLLGVDQPTLRRWQALGLIRAVEGRYDFQDLVSLRAITELIKNGVRPDVISRSLYELASLRPDIERPLAQLKIVADGPEALLMDLDERLVASNGQLVMNFGETCTEPAPMLTRRSAWDWLREGDRCEAVDDFEAAANAYERAIMLKPDFAEAHFNLGNAQRNLDQPLEAIESFREAIRHDPGMADAWYNLADLQEERGELDAAVSSLRSALKIEPSFADAHFNLARCLDALGRKSEAVRHWKSYLQVDATSEWAEVARSRLAL